MPGVEMADRETATPAVETADYINEHVAIDQTGRIKNERHLSKRRVYKLLMLSFGLLCVLQATLNISLRLAYYSDRNITQEYNQLQTRLNHLETSRSQLTDQLDQLKTRCETQAPRNNKLVECFNALTRDRNELRDQVSRLINEKMALEEKKKVLERELSELAPPSVCEVGLLCPAGWRDIGSRCYSLSSEMKTWEGSRADCRSRGAHLVIIRSGEEQRVLFRLEKEDNLLFWIGLTDKERPGTFEWVDGTPLFIKFWQDNQPDGGGPGRREDCVEMDHRHPVNSNWNDLDCGSLRRWLCERDPCPALRPVQTS